MLELPKLPKELKDDTSGIELWGRFISSEKKEDFDMPAQKNPYIESAYERLQLVSQDRQKRLEYEAREKAVRDYRQSMQEAWEAGREAGEKAGREAGEKVGREAGEKAGAHRRNVENARIMKAEGLPSALISKITGLSQEEIDLL